MEKKTKKFKKKKIIKKIIKRDDYSKIDKKKITQTLKLIKTSKRPLILVGNGVHISKAEKKFLIFLKKTNIPLYQLGTQVILCPQNIIFILEDQDCLEIELLILQFSLVICY